MGKMMAFNDEDMDIIDEDDSWLFVAVEVSTKKAKKLKKDSFIKSAEPNYEMKAFAMPAAQEDVDANLRRLKEEIPWGIKVVLENQMDFFDKEDARTLESDELASKKSTSISMRELEGVEVEDVEVAKKGKNKNKNKGKNKNKNKGKNKNKNKGKN